VNSLDIRPGLAGMIARARESLPVDARTALDEHVTQAERLVSDVFGDVPVWTLRGSDSLWIRLTDLAGVMEADRSVVSHAITEGVDRGELFEGEDIRRGVRDEHVDRVDSARSGLTGRPGGVTVVTLRAARLLVMSCRGERGVRFRLGLDRLLDTASATERLLVALLLDRSSPRQDAGALREARMVANALRQAGDKAGAVAYLRRAVGLPELPAVEPAPMAVAAPDADRALALVRALPVIASTAGGRFVGVDNREARAVLAAHGFDPVAALQTWRRRGLLRANHGLVFRTDRQGCALELCMVAAPAAAEA